ncbi:MAG: hypothetical protein B5M54_09495 [Candidatus Aminicenantes bacterium 4484_214]|nr:MAG: hypothetical protein B5M54_09495 [Candidatus Aminicenantes bacterium 4484_214]
MEEKVLAVISSGTGLKSLMTKSLSKTKIPLLCQQILYESQALSIFQLIHTHFFFGFKNSYQGFIFLRLNCPDNQ